jgi:hypothetical protein
LRPTETAMNSRRRIQSLDRISEFRESRPLRQGGAANSNENWFCDVNGKRVQRHRRCNTDVAYKLFAAGSSQQQACQCPQGPDCEQIPHRIEMMRMGNNQK